MIGKTISHYKVIENLRVDMFLRDERSERAKVADVSVR
jgi:hypothetical protein